MHGWQGRHDECMDMVWYLSQFVIPSKCAAQAIAPDGSFRRRRYIHPMFASASEGHPSCARPVPVVLPATRVGRPASSVGNADDTSAGVEPVKRKFAGPMWDRLGGRLARNVASLHRDIALCTLPHATRPTMRVNSVIFIQGEKPTKLLRRRDQRTRRDTPKSSRQDAQRRESVRSTRFLLPSTHLSDAARACW